MTETAVQDRLVFLMETDWKAQAEALLAERLKEGGDAYVRFDCSSSFCF